MEAIVWKKIGLVERVLGWHKPSISSREVLVRVRAAGICTTDLHMITGELQFAEPPWILGHEIAGTVEEIGAEVSDWEIGDRVIVDPVVTCGNCRYCQNGKKYLCPEGGELGTNFGQGGYGQFVAVKPVNLYRLPDAMTYIEGAMMEPLNCTMGAMVRVDNIVGAHAAVFGPGPAGLLFVQLAKAFGASSVTLIGLQDDRLALGAKLGADRLLNISTAQGREQLEQGGFDVVIEASGSMAAVRDCFHYVEKSGTVVLYGLNGSNEPSIVSDHIVGKDLSVVTCISAPLLWEKGIRLVQSGQVNVKDIVTHPIAFGEDAVKVLGQLITRQFNGTKAVMEYKE
jgi:L-iditol 2-dehydrogenase